MENNMHFKIRVKVSLKNLTKKEELFSNTYIFLTN